MKIVFTVFKYLGMYFVSLVLMSFGISKFLETQFVVYNYAQYTPLKDLAPFWHAWSFFGRSYPYETFIGICEVSAAVAILFERTRLIGLLMAAGIYINIIIIDVEFEVYNAITHSTIEFVIVLLLLIPYVPDLKKFFWDMRGKFHEVKLSDSKLRWIVPCVFVVAVSILNWRFLSQAQKDLESTGAYDIADIVQDGDTLDLVGGKFTKRPMLFFEFGSTCILAANDSAYYGRYIMKDDSLTLHFNQYFNDIRSIHATIDKESASVTGLVNREHPILLNLRKDYSLH